MKRLLSLLLLSLAVIAAILGIYISAANDTVLVVDLLLWPAVTVRAGLLLVLSFAAGALAGVLACTLAGAGRRVARGADRPRA